MNESELNKCRIFIDNDNEQCDKKLFSTIELISITLIFITTITAKNVNLYLYIYKYRN